MLEPIFTQEMIACRCLQLFDYCLRGQLATLSLLREKRKNQILAGAGSVLK